MIKFTVHGMPVPQGSMRAFMPKGAKYPVITSANSKLKQWRTKVHNEAIAAMYGNSAAGRNVPIRVEVIFFLTRAKSNKSLDAVKFPDLDKLVRAILDAMTGVLFEDDAQVVEIHAFKTYGNARVEVTVSELLLPEKAMPTLGKLIGPPCHVSEIDEDCPF